MATESKTVDFSKLIVPLARVAELYPQIVELFPDAATTDLGDDAGIVIAAQATFALLNNLWYFPDPEWNLVKHSVFVGFVKETTHHGNTSVSQGAAVRYFTANPEETVVTLLNCGTGGIKFQKYGNKNGLVYVIGESKPGNAVASPQNLAVGNYKPKTQVDNNTLTADGLPEEGAILAFITGTIRAAWEKTADKKEFEEAAIQFFGAASDRIKPITGSDTFFLSQDGEADLEVDAIKSMYGNLALDGMIDPQIKLFGAFGIGRGSTQMSWVPEGPGEKFSTNFELGMNTLDYSKTGLGQLPWTFMSKLHAEFPEFKKVFSSHTGKLMIALKSGCSLWVGGKKGKAVMDLLTSEDKSKTEVSGDQDELLKPPSGPRGAEREIDNSVSEFVLATTQWSLANQKISSAIEEYMLDKTDIAETTEPSVTIHAP